MKKYYNTDIDSSFLGKNIELYGWVNKKRNLGGLIFIDLRDRSGIIQLVIKPDNLCYEEASTLKNESVIKVSGVVSQRESVNKNLKTGDIEVIVDKLNIINMANDLPFEIDNNTNALEDTRLKYRYLDLRREILKDKIITRSKIMTATREFLNRESFIEIETPILCKSTPEGARDYLVPSRINKGSFYALPQSPQIYKQLLMVSGFERYYQIAKCFRDEDLRADRQPEFTQVDVEMSFVNPDDVMSIGEQLVANIFKKVINYDVKLPLRRMKYDDAMALYGSDKPDLRFDMTIKDITDIFKDTEISFIKDIIDNKGIVNCLVVKNKASDYSRKDIDKLTEFVKKYKASGLAFLKYNDEFTGSIAKNMSDIEKDNLIKYLELNNNDLILIVSGTYKVVKTSLGALRCKLGKELGLIDNSSYELLWITDFPVFEYSELEGRYLACHHPFTAPNDSDIDKLLTDKANCYAKAYDIVINGYEAGGGSIRIHDPKVQNIMFEALGLDKKDVNDKFGFLIEAFKYGTPPHGGFALGLDRLTMLLTNTDNIRDVIAFPKTASASDLMCECPSVVYDDQLKDLGLSIMK